MNKKILIVGGVAGGATALARLRRLDQHATIILFERGEYVSFANCGLPYYVGETITPREKLLVSSVEKLETQYGVDVRIQSEVTKINRETKTVDVKNLVTGEVYQESYDTLLLSPGSSPLVFPFPGVDGKNVFTLTTLNDADKIYNFIKDNKVKKALVVGGGFIGLELVENLVHRKIEVTLVEKMNQVMAPLDIEMSEIVKQELIFNGVNVILEDGLKELRHHDHHSVAVLDSNTELETQMIVLAIGVKPNSQLAKDANLEVNQRGGIVVDDYLMSSDPSIYAIGDAVEINDYVLDKRTMIPLAGPANKQGRIAADNIIGGNRVKYPGTIGTSIAKIFDQTVATTGYNEKGLNRIGLKYKDDYLKVLIHPNSHAGYYPGALPMSIKLIFDKQGKVLGSQIVGYDGVDKRIDTISSVIHFKGTIYDLVELECAYAPPYSSAKDPVNMVGYVAQDVLEGLTDPLFYEELTEQHVVLDIRENPELMVGTFDNSVHIPLSELRERLTELNKNQLYVTTCAVGLRGYIAERILKQEGFQAMNLMGGHKTYSLHKHPLERGTQVVDDSGRPEFEEVNTDVLELDACGLSCPGPIIALSNTIDTMKNQQVVHVVASDPGFMKDVESWARNTGHELKSVEMKNKQIHAMIQKKNQSEEVVETKRPHKEKTMIIFSNDLDRAIASFVIATGAAAMGNKVNMFFTFWGLSILKKPEPKSQSKEMMAKMFSMMLPKTSKQLKLSKFNMGGMGSTMMRKVMASKNISSLEELMAQAQKAGVKMTACQMSMDVMGITADELIDGVEIGGVAAMLEDNDNSNMNLFI